MSPSRAETDLWSDYVSALATALEMRKPDALARVRLAVEKLDREISACALRRELRARTGADLSGVEYTLSILVARMDSLRALASRVRATPLDHDYNCTPETAVKASEIVNGDGEYTGEYTSGEIGIQDLSDDLKRAANDIRQGWAVITQGAWFATMDRPPGTYELGNKPAMLAEQYHHFIRELQRKRIQAFPIDDVVCEGLSRAECAAKRRCYVTLVYDQLVAGLGLYAETYPPLTEG